MVYIDQEGVLPPPLNLLPSREALSSFINRFRTALRFTRNSDKKINESASMYFNAMRNAVWANQYSHSNNTFTMEVSLGRIRKTTTTTTVSTALDGSPTHSNSWVSDDEGIVETDPEKVINEFKVGSLFVIINVNGFDHRCLLTYPFHRISGIQYCRCRDRLKFTAKLTRKLH